MIDLTPKQTTYHEFKGYAFAYLDNLFTSTTFTRSNGTLFSRIYERLTKASRRKQSYIDHIHGLILSAEEGQMLGEYYRRGIKDTLEALRTELS